MGAASGSDDRGFSLIEVVVAISVFAIMSVGIAPLIVSSIRGSELARSYTVGKNLVSEAMERIRSLPYYDTAANRDILDLYFPNLVVSGTNGYQSAGPLFRTACAGTSSLPAGSGPKACPPLLDATTSAIPVGYTLTFEAQFVKLVPGSNPETYSVVTPPTGYDSNTTGGSTPPASLVRMTVIASWTRFGATKSFRLVSLLGDRKLSPDRVRATASIDFLVHGVTAYKEPPTGQFPGRLSSLTGFAGRSTADIEIRSFSAASSSNSAGSLVLAEDAIPGNSLEPGGTVAQALGATASFRAPPTAAIDVGTATSATVTHPDLVPATQVGFLGDSRVNETTPLPSTQVVNGLPKASGNFAFSVGGAGDVFWLTNQANRNDPLLQLHPTKNMFTVRETAQKRLSGDTYAEVTDILPAANRKVQATAVGRIGKIIILPTSYMTGDQGVVVIDDFEVSFDCKSTGVVGTSTVSGTWSATLRYWADNDPSDGLALGGYVTIPNTTLRGSIGSASPDPLAAIKATNPVVFDVPGTAGDVHLFALDGKSGYLQDWSSTPSVTSFKDAQTARASMSQAISIVTAQTDITNPETRITIEIGKVSCQAVDKRG